MLLNTRAILATILLVGYGYLLCDMASLSAGGSDSSGYLNSAKLLTEGKFTDSVEPLNRFGLGQEDIRVFIPLGFSPGAKPGTMVPSYPPGLPLHMAAAALLGGWTRAPFWISPLAAVASLLLIYGVGRELGLPRAFAAAAPAILAAFPTFIFLALQPMSDVPATAWALAAIFAALLSRRKPRAAFLCGAALGVGVLVRPTNILLAVPLLFALPLGRQVYIRVLLGGLGFALFLLAYNWICNGSPWVSGYGAVLGSFSSSLFPERARHYVYWLAALGSPLLPLGWLAIGTVSGLQRRDRALLIAWFAIFFLFYSCYDPYSAWWYTRFLLPAVPAMIVATLIVAERGPSRGKTVRDASVRARRARMLLLVLICASTVLTGVYWTRRYRLLKTYRDESVYPEWTRWAEASLPKNSIVAAIQVTGTLRYYTDVTFVRIDWMEPARFPLLRERIERRGYRWYALVVPFERDDLKKNLPGLWQEAGNFKGLSLLRLESGVR